MIELRTLTADDWEHWRDLRLAALGEAPDSFHSTLADWRDADEARWRAKLADFGLMVVADLAGRPAGMIGGRRADRDTAWLTSLWVAPSGRGHGVGDALIATVLDWSRATGARQVLLGVFADNAAAAGLYRRHGFVDVGPSPGDPRERRMSRPCLP